MHTFDLQKEDFTHVSLEFSNFPSVVERYYSKYYKVNLPSGVINEEKFETTQNDVCILKHSNKICIVTLAPSHPILKNKEIVTSVSFQISERCNRNKNHVSGKRKRGAQWLNSESPLCIITCENGNKHTIFSGIRGNLVEVNENLLKTPSLLTTKPQTQGYIGVVMVKMEEHVTMIDKLLNDEMYNKYLENLKSEFKQQT